MAVSDFITHPPTLKLIETIELVRRQRWSLAKEKVAELDELINLDEYPDLAMDDLNDINGLRYALGKPILETLPGEPES